MTPRQQDQEIKEIKRMVSKIHDILLLDIRKDRIISTQEATQILNCSLSTLMKRIYKGEIPARKNGHKWEMSFNQIQQLILS